MLGQGSLSQGSNSGAAHSPSGGLVDSAFFGPVPTSNLSAGPSNIRAGSGVADQVMAPLSPASLSEVTFSAGAQLLPLSSGASSGGVVKSAGAGGDDTSAYFHRLTAPVRSNAADASLASHRALHPDDGPLTKAFNEFAPRAPFSDVEWDVISTVSFERLNHVQQMSFGYSSGARDPGGSARKSFQHTRGAHSDGAHAIAAFLAAKNNLPEPVAIAFRLAALLHDIGHVPFSHSGEEILRHDNRFNQADGSRFCHDKFGCQRILTGDIGEAIRRSGAKYGVTPEMVVAILQDSDGLGFAVKEIADRLDYLTRDLMETKFLEPIKNQLKEATELCLGAKITFIGDARDSGSAGSLGFVGSTEFKPAEWRMYLDGDAYSDRASPLWKLLSLRQILFLNYSLHPKALVANAVLSLATAEAFEAGNYDNVDFRLLTDRQAIELFKPKAARLFDQENPLSVDENYVSVGWCSLAQVKEPGVVSSSTYAREVKNYLLEQFPTLTQWDLFFCATPLENKSVSFDLKTRKGEVRTDEFNFVPDLEYCRAFLAVSKDLDPELQKEIATVFEGYMKDGPGLKSGQRLVRGDLLPQPVHVDLFLGLNGSSQPANAHRKSQHRNLQRSYMTRR